MIRKTALGAEKAPLGAASPTGARSVKPGFHLLEIIFRTDLMVSKIELSIILTNIAEYSPRICRLELH
jgi:hypothetical protein